MSTFGNVDLARKMVERFGMAGPPIKVKLVYTEEVEAFIKKIDRAKKAAAKSSLRFG